MVGRIWRKTKAVLLSLPLTMPEGKWPLAFFLGFLYVCELFLPFNGRAQSLSDTGLFYFTGSHRPVQVRNIQFREFMGQTNGLKVGPVRLHPFLGVAEVFTDNVFKRDKNRKSDFLTTIAPGLQALLPFGEGKHSVLLDYRATQFLYKNFTGNNVLAQNAQGHVSLNFPGGLSMDFQGGYLEGYDPRGSELDTQQRNITKWNNNTLFGQIEYSGQKAGIRFRSSYINLHYTNNGQSDARDRTRVLSDVTVFANATRSTSALLGVQIQTNDYDKNTQLNSFGYGVFTGFRSAPTRRLAGEFNIGYYIFNTDHATIDEDSPEGKDLEAQGLSLGTKQRTFLYLKGNLYWNPTSRLSFRVTPYRRVQQSAVFNTGTYIRTGINISGRQAFTERFAFRGFLSYMNGDFDSGRNDNLFRWRMGPEYRAVKWLGFRLDYIFDKRSSNQDNFNFYSNTIMFSVQGFL